MDSTQAKRRSLVLVVDDGAQHVMLLRLALMQRGYAVVVVHTVEGACTMVRERNVDALLVTAPLDAAVSVLRALGQDRPKLVAALAPDEPDGAERVKAAGFDIALARPIDFAELDTVLREGMRRRSGMRPRVGVDAASSPRRRKPGAA